MALKLKIQDVEDVDVLRRPGKYIICVLISKGSLGIEWLSNYWSSRFNFKLNLIGAQIICVQFEKNEVFDFIKSSF